jgi:hypothetical protein
VPSLSSEPFAQHAPLLLFTKLVYFVVSVSDRRGLGRSVLSKERSSLALNNRRATR